MMANRMLPALRQPRGLIAASPTTSSPGPTIDPETLRALSQPAHVFTPRGTITITNPAFDAMFGVPSGRYVGRHQAALNGASVEANLKLLEEIRQAVDSQGFWEGTLQNRRVDGLAFTTRAWVHPTQVEGRPCLVCVQEEQHGRLSST